MKLRINLAVIFTMAALYGFAQSPAYNWGPELKMEEPKREETKPVFLGGNEEDMYYIHKVGETTNYDMILTKVNAQTNEVEFQNDVDPGFGSMDDFYTYCDAVYSKSLNKVIVGGSGFIKEDQKANAGVHVIGHTGVWKRDDMIKLLEYPAEKAFFSGNVTFNISEDGTKLFVMVELPTDKEQNERMILACYSTEDWSEIWKKEVDLDFPDKNIKNNRVYGSNAGDIFIIKSYSEKLKYHHILYELHAKNLTLKTTPIEIPEHGMSKFDATEHPNGNMIFTAYSYEYKKSISSANGYIYISAGSRAPGEVKHVIFSNDLLSNYYSENQLLKGKNTIQDLEYRGSQMDEKGNIWIFGEVFTESKTAIEGKPNTYKYIRNYKDIVVLKLNENGDLQWSYSLNRAQNRTEEEPNDDLGRCQFLVSSGKVYIIWNMLSTPKPYGWDLPDKRKMKIEEVFGSKAAYGIFYTVLDESGKNLFEDQVFKCKPISDFYKDGFNFKMINHPEMSCVHDNRLYVYTALYPTKLRVRRGYISFE